MFDHGDHRDCWLLRKVNVICAQSKLPLLWNLEFSAAGLLLSGVITLKSSSFFYLLELMLWQMIQQGEERQLMLRHVSLRFVRFAVLPRV